MEAYRIQTKLVSEIIKLPQITKWIGQEVEIIILPIQEIERVIKKRPFGLAKSDFQIPDSFFDELSNDILKGFGVV